MAARLVGRQRRRRRCARAGPALAGRKVRHALAGGQRFDLDGAAVQDHADPAGLDGDVEHRAQHDHAVRGGAHHVPLPGRLVRHREARPAALHLGRVVADDQRPQRRQDHVDAAGQPAMNLLAGPGQQRAGRRRQRLDHHRRGRHHRRARGDHAAVKVATGDQRHHAGRRRRGEPDAGDPARARRRPRRLHARPDALLVGLHLGQRGRLVQRAAQSLLARTRRRLQPAVFRRWRHWILHACPSRRDFEPVAAIPCSASRASFSSCTRAR